jgi:hypothetical protein
MKVHWGVEVYLHSFVDLGTRWKWVVSFTARPLYLQGKSPQYPLDRSLDGPQSRSGRGGEKKNSQPPQRIEPYNPDRPACSLLAIPIELSRLLLPLPQYVFMERRFIKQWVSLRAHGQFYRKL